MSFYGRDYGGTNSRDGIYVASDSEIDDFEKWPKEALHAEFSSILCRNYPFPWAEWASANEKGWQYIGYGKDLSILDREDLDDQTEDLLSKGFLSVYAQTSREEDFNAYAAHFFERRSSLLAAASRHKRIGQKLALVSSFYERIRAHPDDTGEVLMSRERALEVERLRSAVRAEAMKIDRAGELPDNVFCASGLRPIERHDCD